MLHRVTREHLIYAMSASNQPVATVQPGDLVTFETNDCFDGQVPHERRPLSKAGRQPGRVNPATGPVAVVGAEPGMTLVVTIESVELPEAGLIFDDRNGGDDPPGRVVPVRDGCLAQFAEAITVNCDPVIGTIGVAPPPREGAIPDTTPGDHGGNLDTIDIRTGAIVYLPIFVPGALFALGDVHAAQGDGEMCGEGLELPAEVTVRLRLLDRAICSGPVVETADRFAVIASARTLDEAIEPAMDRARDLLAARLGLDPHDAMMLLSLAADLRISQVVNPLRTVRVCIPKTLLASLG